MKLHVHIESDSADFVNRLLGHPSLGTFLPRIFAENFQNGSLDKLKPIINHSLKFSITIYFAAFLSIVASFLITEGSPSIENSAVIIAIVLLLGIGVNVFSGFCGFALTMSNHQGRAARIAIFGALLNVILNFLFIPILDGIGAAVATVISMSFVYPRFSSITYQEIKINTTVFGKRIHDFN